MSGRPKKERRAREAKAVREGLDLEIAFTHYRLLWSADWACLAELVEGMKTHGFPTDLDVSSRRRGRPVWPRLTNVCKNAKSREVVMTPRSGVGLPSMKRTTGIEPATLSLGS
jgi:hypothetical protein